MDILLELIQLCLCQLNMKIRLTLIKIVLTRRSPPTGLPKIQIWNYGFYQLDQSISLRLIKNFLDIT